MPPPESLPLLESLELELALQSDDDDEYDDPDEPLTSAGAGIAAAKLPMDAAQLPLAPAPPNAPPPGT